MSADRQVIDIKLVEAREDLTRAWDRLLLATHPSEGMSRSGREQALEAIQHVRESIACVHKARLSNAEEPPVT